MIKRTPPTITRRHLAAGVLVAPFLPSAASGATSAASLPLSRFIADLRDPNCDPAGAGDMTTGELWLREAIADELERICGLEPVDYQPFMRAERDREWANRRAAAERRQALRSVR